MHFSNSLEVSSLLFVLALLFRNVFGYLYIYAWLAIIIFQFVAEKAILGMPIQYGVDKTSMIVLLVLAVTVQILADWLSFRKRRHWQENTTAYRLYHHNGHLAEWVNTRASDIKAGNVFKVEPGQHFPTDCLLIYSENSMLKIN